MVGGNYWGTPDGTGFSEADVDADRDGFCGHADHLSTGNINSYPLAGVSSPIAGLSANVTNGTAPLAIGFTDVTAGFPTRWTWTDPTDSDFAQVRVYLNESAVALVLLGVQTYTVTDLTPGTTYTLGVQALDQGGNAGSLVPNVTDTISSGSSTLSSMTHSVPRRVVIAPIRWPNQRIYPRRPRR